MNTKAELSTIKNLVMRMLEMYPETRNSDTKLYFQCCRDLGALTIDDAEEINLNIITIHKVRQKIQNGLGLFLPDKEVSAARYERQLSFRDWMVEM